MGNLKYSVTNDELEELFTGQGEVRAVNVIDGKGFGFVEMSTTTEAQTAKEALNETDFMGRALRIDEARPPRSRDRSEYRRY